MAEVTLPNEMQYLPPSVAARARAYRQSIVPMNNSQSYKPNDRIRIMLGTTPGTYLNLQHSFIEFDIVNGDATNRMTIDKHASAFIDRIEIYHAGALLDTVAGANVLYSLLLDTTVAPAEMQTTHVTGGVADQAAGGFWAPVTNAINPTTAWGHQTSSILSPGYDYAATGLTTAAIGIVNAKSSLTILNTNTLAATDILSDRRTNIIGDTIAASGYRHVAFPLIGLFSPAALSRYLPLGDAVNGSLEINIYLASSAIPAYGTAWSGAWSLQNVEYQAQLVELDAAVHGALVQSIGGMYTLPYQSWRNYNTVIPVGTTTFNYYIPTKVSSMSGVVVVMRDSLAQVTTKSSVALRSRGNGYYLNAASVLTQRANSLQSAQLRVGALNFPLKPVGCSFKYAALQNPMVTDQPHNIDNALIESYKMFGRLGTTMGATCISRAEYIEDKFFLAFDTQTYSAASAAIDDGVQAQHGSTYLQLNWDGAGSGSLANGGTTILDVFILFDGMLTVANGAISAAF